MGYRRQPLQLIWQILYPLLIYQLIRELVFAGWCSIRGDVPPALALPLTAVSAAITVLPLGVLYLRQTQMQREPGTALKHSAQKQIMIVIGAACGGACVCLLFNHILLRLPFVVEQYGQAQQLLYQPSVPLQLLCMGLVIPLTEELIFRALAYVRLRNAVSFAGAAVLSALYFGLFHGNLAQGIYAGLLGLLLAALYEYSHSLLAVWVFHAAANMTAIFVSQGI